MNLLGDPILAEEAFELGLANRVVEDHELFDVRLAPGRGGWLDQAPLSVSEIKELARAGDLDRGPRRREPGLRDRLRLCRRQGGHRRLPRQAPAPLRGQLTRARLSCARPCSAPATAERQIGAGAELQALSARSRSGAMSQRSASR